MVGEEDVPRLRFAGTPSSLGKDFPRRDMFLVDTGGLPSRRADVRQRDLGAGAWGNGNRPAVAADDIGAGGIGSDAGGIWSGIGKLEAARARQRDLAVAGAWRASAAGKGERGSQAWERRRDLAPERVRERRRDLAGERVRERWRDLARERVRGAGLGCGARRRSKRSRVNEDRPQCQGHRRVVDLASEPSAGHANDLGFISLLLIVLPNQHFC